MHSRAGVRRRWRRRGEGESRWRGWPPACRRGGRRRRLPSPARSHRPLRQAARPPPGGGVRSRRRLHRSASPFPQLWPLQGICELSESTVVALTTIWHTASLLQISPFQNLTSSPLLLFSFSLSLSNICVYVYIYISLLFWGHRNLRRVPRIEREWEGSRTRVGDDRKWRERERG